MHVTYQVNRKEVRVIKSLHMRVHGVCGDRIYCGDAEIHTHAEAYAPCYTTKPAASIATLPKDICLHQTGANNLKKKAVHLHPSLIHSLTHSYSTAFLISP